MTNSTPKKAKRDMDVKIAEEGQITAKKLICEFFDKQMNKLLSASHFDKVQNELKMLNEEHERVFQDWFLLYKEGMDGNEESMMALTNRILHPDELNSCVLTSITPLLKMSEMEIDEQNKFYVLVQELMDFFDSNKENIGRLNLVKLEVTKENPEYEEVFF